MKLNDALKEVADYLALDAVYLQQLARGDELLGEDIAGAHYGLIPYTADGYFLYALVRAFQPDHILESGVDDGGSIEHMDNALSVLNQGGQITGVDINPEAGGIYRNSKAYRHIHIVHEDIVMYVQRDDLPVFQFIHEDASHEIHTVRAVYEALPRLMPQGGVIVSHDTATGVRDAILTGIRNAGFDEPPLLVEFDESPCGFSVMKYAGVKS